MSDEKKIRFEAVIAERIMSDCGGEFEEHNCGWSWETRGTHLIALAICRLADAIENSAKTLALMQDKDDS